MSGYTASGNKTWKAKKAKRYKKDHAKAEKRVQKGMQKELYRHAQ